MTIFIDKDFKCFVSNSEEMTAVETAIFDGKCKAFIEGHRYIPEGSMWTREDGVVFSGEMIAPFVDVAILMAYQEQYEAMLAEQQDMQTALETLGVNVNG